MAVNLRTAASSRSSDFTRDELGSWSTSPATQAREVRGQRGPALAGKNIALIFEKTSTRTRCAFEVAAYDQGAHVTYLDPRGSQIGHKESVRDTARVLGRMFDGIEYRGYAQDDVEELAAHAGRARLERAHRRVAPDADARRPADDARARATSRSTRSRTATSATAATTWATRCSSPAR